MKQRFIDSIGIAGMMLTWTWPVFVVLSFATTCTMGDDGSWTATLVICTLLTAVALPALLVSASSDTGARMRLSVPVMTLGPLALALVHAVDVGFGIHHLCGPEYDDYLTPGITPTRVYYPLMWVYALTLSMAASRPWLRVRARARAEAVGAV